MCRYVLGACVGGGLDPLRTNHGDTGPITPVGKAALRNLGNQWPEIGNLGQTLSGKRLEEEFEPVRLGMWATSDSPLCLSKLYRKKGDREVVSKGRTQTHTSHRPPTGHTCARGSTCVILLPSQQP